MTVVDTGMVIVVIGNIAAVTGATPTATTTPPVLELFVL